MTKQKVQAEPAEASFEEDLKRLEVIVRELETGTLPLEEAFRRFEEGVRLSRACKARLESVEGRVAELLSDGSTRSITPAPPDA